MPRKKATTAAPVPPPVAEKETVTLTIEVSQTLHKQIIASIAACGYASVNEWLLEAVLDKV